MLLIKISPRPPSLPSPVVLDPPTVKLYVLPIPVN